MDGNLLVKRIKFAENAIEEQPLLQVTVVNPPAGSVPRVRWLSKTRLAASIGDAIFGVDVDLKAREPVVFTAELAATGMPGGAPPGFTVFAPLGQKPSINDFDFSPEGSLGAPTPTEPSASAAPTGEGDVIDSASSGTPPWTPPSFSDPDGALASIAWVGEDSLVVGGESNKTLALWKLGSGDMEGAELVNAQGVRRRVQLQLRGVPPRQARAPANLRKQSVRRAPRGGGGWLTTIRVFRHHADPVFTALKESDDPSSLQLYCIAQAISSTRCTSTGADLWVPKATRAIRL